MSLFYTAGARLQQAANRAARSGRPERQTVEEGTGTVFSIGQLLRANRLHKPLVVTEPGAERVRERVLHALLESDTPGEVWNLEDRTQTDEDADALRLAWLRAECDCFIALGGAKAIDFVKVSAALTAERGRSLMSLVGSGKLRRRLPPVIVIPTEPGSGAESLAWAEFADGSGQRYLIEDKKLVPPFLVLDPELMEDAPRSALASAAADGLCLAVEAFLSGYGDSVSRAAAADAVRGYLADLEPCWNSGGTMIERSALMAASRLAGEAASVAGPGYVRALCRAAVRVTGVEPGSFFGAVLPVAMEKYGNQVSARLSELAEITGEKDSAALIARIRQLVFRIGLPDTLDALPNETIEEIASLAAAEANPRYSCPVVWSAAELAVVLRAVCAVREL